MENIFPSPHKHYNRLSTGYFTHTIFGLETKKKNTIDQIFSLTFKVLYKLKVDMVSPLCDSDVNLLGIRVILWEQLIEISK